MNMNATAQMVTVSQGGKPREKPKPATGGSNPYYEAHFGDEQHQPSCQSITSARGVGPFPCDCKPATGEWTVETIAVIRGRDGDFGLAAAINAEIAMLADALHFYRNHDDNGQTATDALRKIGK